jgi:FkbM family methyltransferase
MSCRDLVMVDIGANKGYKLATWAGVFRPELGLFPDTLFRKFVEVYGDFEDMGGSCQDFEDARLPLLAGRSCAAGAPVGAPAPPERAAASYALALHAFEPLPGNAGVLHRVVEPWVNERGGGTATLTVHQLAAVGDKSISQVEFGACLAGNERCGVKTKGFDGGDVYSKGNIVPAITVDAWFAEQGLQQVDVLAIDAEGHDAEVIKGADEVLRRQGARIVEFECVGRPRLCGWGRAPRSVAPNVFIPFKTPTPSRAGTTCCATGRRIR